MSHCSSGSTASQGHGARHCCHNDKKSGKRTYRAHFEPQLFGERNQAPGQILCGLIID
ncbi:hypothetical protein AZA_49668 [Nitrospirillum viridazoti Y2]|nr:hypothetical protein AZA_49668 [Nitrospirillum amazonense Y2]